MAGFLNLAESILVKTLHGRRHKRKGRGGGWRFCVKTMQTVFAAYRCRVATWL